MRCEVVTADQLADRDAGMILLRERLLALNPDSDTKKPLMGADGC